MGDDPAINDANITAWLGERTELEPPLRSELIAGGRSNMTYTVTDAAGRRFVLRRPPLGELLPSAHDMAREHRLMHALRDTDVPVPVMVGLCQDSSVNHRDFYVMRYVDGLVVRDVEIGRTLSPASRAAIRRFSVPVMLHSCVSTGSATERGTDGTAAWWST